MRALAAILLITLCVTGAAAQSILHQPLVAAGPQNVLRAASTDAPIVGLLSDGQTVHLMEVEAGFARIDAEGISGPAYVPLQAVRVGQPPPGTPRCACPGWLREDQNLCGGASAFCREGGREYSCYLGGQTREQACRQQPTSE
jgi:hypothetical protein